MTSRTEIRRKLDKVHSRFIRMGNPRCVVCGTPHNIQCGHLYSRASSETRWDTAPDGNCHPQCASCNMRHEEYPLPFFQWYLDKFGEEKLDSLRLRWHSTRQFSKSEMLEKIKELEVACGES